ncbi:hypothetical protein ACVWXN_004908 [Bradyrhizobium sp. i1.4.4]
MQRAVPAIPQADCEHTIAALESLLQAPFLDQGQQDLRITIAGEALACALELLPQWLVVVDLAVERNDEAAVARKHWLPARIGEIDDGQPAMPERNAGVTIAPEPVRIRTAVAQASRHRPDRRQVGGSRSMRRLKYSCNSTHCLTSNSRLRQ